MFNVRSGEQAYESSINVTVGKEKGSKENGEVEKHLRISPSYLGDDPLQQYRIIRLTRTC